MPYRRASHQLATLSAVLLAGGQLACGLTPQGEGQARTVGAFTLAAAPSPLLSWDADDASNILDGSNNYQQLTDLFGNGRHAVQATAGSRPTSTAAGLNSRRILNSVAAGGRFIELASLGLGAFSVYLIARASTTNFLWHHAAGVTYLYPSTGASMHIVRSAITCNRDRAAGWATDNTWRLVTIRYDGTEAGYTMRINGVAQALTTTIAADPGTATATGVFTPLATNGGGTQTTGNLAALVAYGAAHDAATAAKIEALLNARWGVY